MNLQCRVNFRLIISYAAPFCKYSVCFMQVNVSSLMETCAVGDVNFFGENPNSLKIDPWARRVDSQKMSSLGCRLPLPVQT